MLAQHTLQSVHCCQVAAVLLLAKQSEYIPSTDVNTQIPTVSGAAHLTAVLTKLTTRQSPLHTYTPKP